MQHFSSTWRYKTFHFPHTFFPYFFKPQRLKCNVSCFLSTWRYKAFHFPYFFPVLFQTATFEIHVTYFSSIFSKSFHYSIYFSFIISISFHYSTYFSYILSISFQLTFLPYCPYHFTIFFCIFHIISHFNLLFFHIFHIISQFSSVFSISFHYSSHVSSIIFIFFLIISFYSYQSPTNSDIFSCIALRHPSKIFCNPIVTCKICVKDKSVFASFNWMVLHHAFSLV
jgi:hypothetical protein